MAPEAIQESPKLLVAEALNDSPRPNLTLGDLKGTDGKRVNMPKRTRRQRSLVVKSEAGRKAVHGGVGQGGRNTLQHAKRVGRTVLSMVKKPTKRRVPPPRPPNNVVSGGRNTCVHPIECNPSPGSEDNVRSTSLRIMTWNVDGFNDPARRLAITSYLWKHKVDIAVITESHLLDKDIFQDPGDGKERIMRLKLEHYHVIHWHNREETVNHRCGGVLIIARAGIDCTLVPQDLLPSRPLSCCSLIVTAVGGCSLPFRLTGVYFPPPPTARVTHVQAAPLLHEHEYCKWENAQLNHIICGDLNPPSWKEDFDEWLSASGL